MSYLRFGRNPCSSLFLLLASYAMAEIKFTLEDGSQVRLPENMVSEMTFRPLSGGETLIASRHINGSGLFAFLSRRRLGNPEPFSDFFLNHLGLKDLERRPLKDEAGPPGKDPRIERILSPGLYQNYLLTLSLVELGERESGFLFLAPEEDFYKIKPQFDGIVERLEVVPGSLDPYSTKIPPWMLEASVLLIVLNVAAVWFGFREIGKRGKWSEEEDPLPPIASEFY